MKLLDRPNEIVIRATPAARRGWSEAAKAMAARGEDELLDEGLSHTSWDEEEWEW
jgi:hypothetical protein